jgi:His/Glu/Gln/Arg/opine family amino acid ABC transporter permease subunit
LAAQASVVDVILAIGKLSVPEMAQQLVPGAVTTLLLTAAVMPLSLLPAFGAALVRIRRLPIVSQVATFYVEFFRSTPLLLQLFFAFYALPFVGLSFAAVPTAVVVLTLHFGAYESEIVRAAMLAVSPGLTEAAQALGMSQALTWRRVVVPLALRIMFPPMGNSLLELLKATALVSLIGVHDIVYVGSSTGAQTFQTTLAFGLIAAFYLVVGYPTSRVLKRLERKVAVP